MMFFYVCTPRETYTVDRSLRDFPWTMHRQDVVKTQRILNLNELTRRNVCLCAKKDHGELGWYDFFGLLNNGHKKEQTERPWHKFMGCWLLGRLGM